MKRLFILVLIVLACVACTSTQTSTPAKSTASVAPGLASLKKNNPSLYREHGNWDEILNATCDVIEVSGGLSDTTAARLVSNLDGTPKTAAEITFAAVTDKCPQYTLSMQLWASSK